VFGGVEALSDVFKSVEGCLEVWRFCRIFLKVWKGVFEVWRFRRIFLKV